MARSSGSPGDFHSYRQWAAAERTAQKEREQPKRQAEKERIAAEATARDEVAAARTAEIEQRVAELESILRSSIGRDPRIGFDSLRITGAVPPLDLGPLASPAAEPRWADFAPRPPSGLGRMLGGSQRYQASYQAAERSFADAQADHQEREAARQRAVVAACTAWKTEAAEAERNAEVHNAHVDKLASGFREHDRFAVSEYVQMVLDSSSYPDGFPARRHAGYVPESSLLAV